MFSSNTNSSMCLRAWSEFSSPDSSLPGCRARDRYINWTTVQTHRTWITCLHRCSWPILPSPTRCAFTEHHCSTRPPARAGRLSDHAIMHHVVRNALNCWRSLHWHWLALLHWSWLTSRRLASPVDRRGSAYVQPASPRTPPNNLVRVLDLSHPVALVACHPRRSRLRKASEPTMVWNGAGGTLSWN